MALAKGRLLYAFKGGSDGADPTAELIADAKGALYGTTVHGGGGCDLGCGTVFRLTPPANRAGKWSESVLYRFIGAADGFYPAGGLVLDEAGALFGTAQGSSSGCGVAFMLTPPAGGKGAWKESVLHTFRCPPDDGAGPNGTLVFDAAGALFGTTEGGGDRGSGTVFKLSPPKGGGHAWSETILYNQSGGVGGNIGAPPSPGVVLDGQGAVYDTAFGGPFAGSGSIFEWSKAMPQGTALYRFPAFDGDGDRPEARLFLAKNGVFYGTTAAGGDPNFCPKSPGCGTVFSFAPKSGGGFTETVLHSFAFFTDPDDGYAPNAPVMLSSSGILYGTTPTGGTGTGCGAGSKGSCGTIFEVDKNGAYRVAASFRGSATGDIPNGPLVEFKGTFYGTTFGGGANCPEGGIDGCGTVFSFP